MYRQVLDLYATSADYNPNSAESIAFFKMVQNKLHYAVNREFFNLRRISNKKLVSEACLDHSYMAEYQAENHNVMHMSDYVEQLDRTIQSVGEEVLVKSG